MRSFALILVAFTTVATAAPGPREDTGRYGYGNDRPRPRNPGWTELATPTTDMHGTEFVMVGRDAGRFSQLRIVANTGRVEVRRVAVNFADGTKRTYRVDHTISEHRDRAVDIDLQADKEIDQIAVTTWRNNATYSVYGL